MDFAAAIYLTFAFLIGINVGSFLNVVVGRLPYEKSLLWPNSRCLTCLHSLALTDNLPIVGWLLRRGRCRYCGSAFSSRYLWVELATGVGFAGLFYVDVLSNWFGMPFLDSSRAVLQTTGVPPRQAVIVFLHHAVLFSFLLAAALCDWDHKAIPLSLTVVGTLVGLVQATVWSWPYPNDVAATLKLHAPIVNMNGVREQSWSFDPVSLPIGLYPWPVWGPLPNWWVQHGWALGLLTGLAGALAGMVLIRMVKFTFEKGLGKEALGLGDADLMMMSGAFLGWQPVVVAFFIGSIVSLPLLGVIYRIRKGEQAFPFGPGMALGVMITLLAWPWIGPKVQLYLFEESLVLLAAALLAGGLFIGSIAVRILGFGQVPSEPAVPVRT